MRLVLSPGRLPTKPRRRRLSKASRPAARSSPTAATTRAIVELVESRGGQAQIPTCSDRKVQRVVDAALYRKRNLVERFFNKLKHFRRIATRYDKTARNFLAAVALAATRLWLRFESTT